MFRTQQKYGTREKCWYFHERCDKRTKFDFPICRAYNLVWKFKFNLKCKDYINMSTKQNGMMWEVFYKRDTSPNFPHLIKCVLHLKCLFHWNCELCICWTINCCWSIFSISFISQLLPIHRWTLPIIKFKLEL